MAGRRKKTPQTPYKTPRLISFVTRASNAKGYCGAGSSDLEACGDGAAPLYCTNGTVHTPPWCSAGEIASSVCGTGGALNDLSMKR